MGGRQATPGVCKSYRRVSGSVSDGVANQIKAVPMKRQQPVALRVYH